MLSCFAPVIDTASDYDRRDGPSPDVSSVLVNDELFIFDTVQGYFDEGVVKQVSKNGIVVVKCKLMNRGEPTILDLKTAKWNFKQRVTQGALVLEGGNSPWD